MLASGCSKSASDRLFEQYCEQCHGYGSNVPGAPTPSVLSGMPADAILASLESGRMSAQGAAMTPEERQVLAEGLGRDPGAVAGDTPRCRPDQPLDLEGPVHWRGYSPDLANTRFNEAAGLNAANIGELELVWAFGLPNDHSLRVQPAIVGNALFVGSNDGRLFALDRETACVHWVHSGPAEVRSSIEYGPPAEGGAPLLYYGDFKGYAQAVDPTSGEIRWRVRVDDHPQATITGTPALHEGRLYVPVSSFEVAIALDPTYPCCNFVGAVVALDAATGERIWTSKMGPPAEVTGTTWGREQRGPSGAPIWTSPTIDAKRGVLYVGTGENYSSPANEWSDAVVALDLATGERRWSVQATERDAFNISCAIPGHPNCPEEDGPDLDFGASVALHTDVQGRDRLFAGQKSSVVWALDPDANGAVLWNRRIGSGGTLGGVHWGISAAPDTVLVPNSDRNSLGNPDEEPRPGLAALDPATGEERWFEPHVAACREDRDGCRPGLSAASIAAPGFVVTGGLDGVVEARAIDDGRSLWRIQTARDWETVNGVEAMGGAIDGPQLVLADGWLFVSSGYAMFDQMYGNVLLAFRPKAKTD
jgi:polyvinyl alcohol dehydrogenase (cytochrome)